MKDVTRYRIKVAYGKTPREFENSYNKIMDNLPSCRDIDEQVIDKHDKGLCMLIRYKEYEKIPETFEDELHIRGLEIHCKDCPYLQVTNDRRRKRFPCIYATHGHSFLDSPVCNKFYEDLIKVFFELSKSRKSIGETNSLPDFEELPEGHPEAE